MGRSLIKSIIILCLQLFSSDSVFGQTAIHANQIPIQMKDNAREIPHFLDIGMFQTYRFTEAEINTIIPVRLHQLIEIYIRRYYDLYLYFSRDIIAKQCAEGYPADLIEPVVMQTLGLGDEKLRSMLIDFYHRENGVANENMRLFSQIKPIIENWEIKMFGKVKSKNLPATHSANAIFLAYVKKMGIRPLDYYPPFYPKTKLDNVLKEDKPKFQYFEYLGFLLFGLILGIVFDRLWYKLKQVR